MGAFAARTLFVVYGHMTETTWARWLVYLLVAWAVWTEIGQTRRREGLSVSTKQVGTACPSDHPYSMNSQGVRGGYCCSAKPAPAMAPQDDTQTCPGRSIKCSSPDQALCIDHVSVRDTDASVGAHR